MLILVGVTISVALNGGLFNIAQDVATNTIIEAEKEQLLSAVTVAYDVETGTINKAKLEANLGTGWSVEGENAPYTVTSPKGNKYTVDADGNISDGTSKTKTYSFTIGDLLAKVNNETNTITLGDLKELCNDENLAISKYLTIIDGTNLCYITSDETILCSMKTFVDKMKEQSLKEITAIFFTTTDNGETFKCNAVKFYGNTVIEQNEVLLTNLSQDIKNVTMTLSDKTDFE